MKKIIFLFVVVLFSGVTNSSFAQYANRDVLFNLGIGVNSYYSGGIPLSASLEFGATDAVSVGLGFDYLGYRYTNGSTRYGFTTLYFAVRGSYHFNELLNLRVQELDVYGGASLGFRSFSWKDSNSFSGLGNVYGSGIFLGIHAGCRYYFSDNIGAFLELGAGGSSNARAGLAFKF